VTLGGEDDNGRGLPPEARDVLSQIADSFGVRLFTSESIAQAVSKRVEAFAGCRVLITVGLPVTNSGDPLVRLQSKIYLDRHAKAGNALVARFIATGRPAVNIAKPSRIALDYRLPVAPVPQPEIGKGRLFYERRYSVPLALVSAFIIIILLVLVVRYDVEYYFGVRTEDEKAAV
jgi:poly-gamma-glutamate system protein